jgi:hypothetical protein
MITVCLVRGRSLKSPLSFPCFSGQTLRNVSDRLLKETDPWHLIDFDGILHDSNTIEGMSHRTFMTILRHALSAMKVRLIFYIVKLSFDSRTLF